MREREQRRLSEQNNNEALGDIYEDTESGGEEEEGGGLGAGQDSQENGEEEEEEWEGRRGRDANYNSRTTYSLRNRQRGSGGGPGGDDSGDSGDDSGDDVEGEVGKIPHEILKMTAPTAVRLNISVDQHLCMTAAFLKSSNVDIDKFPLSHSTALRRRKEVLAEEYADVRERFHAEMEGNDHKLFLHLDTKALKDSIGPEGAAVNNTR